MGALTDIWNPKPEKKTFTMKAKTPIPPPTGATMEAGCMCESCSLLRTPIGRAMMEWGSGLIKAATEAVEMGADPDAELTMNLQGPDATALKTQMVGAGNQSYTELTLKLSEFGNDPYYSKQHRLLAPPPEWGVLKEEYADDPVVLELIGWMERRVKGG